MKNNDKHFAGVWLDNNNAMVIAKNTDEEEYSIQDKLKTKENHGGGSEHSINNARQSENLKFFKSLSGLLMKYDEILLFGPGKSQEQFHNHLGDDSQFNNKKISIETADQLTDPQMIAKVRDHFKNRQ